MRHGTVSFTPPMILMCEFENDDLDSELENEVYAQFYFGQDKSKIIETPEVKPPTLPEPKWIIKNCDVETNAKTLNESLCEKCQFRHKPNECSQLDHIKDLHCELCGTWDHAKNYHGFCNFCFRIDHLSNVCVTKKCVRKCFLCKTSNHLSQVCPNLWRQFHMTTQKDQIITLNPKCRLKNHTSRQVYCLNLPLDKQTFRPNDLKNPHSVTYYNVDYSKIDFGRSRLHCCLICGYSGHLANQCEYTHSLEYELCHPFDVTYFNCKPQLYAFNIPSEIDNPNYKPDNNFVPHSPAKNSAKNNHNNNNKRNSPFSLLKAFPTWQSDDSSEDESSELKLISTNNDNIEKERKPNESKLPTSKLTIIKSPPRFNTTRFNVDDVNDGNITRDDTRIPESVFVGSFEINADWRYPTMNDILRKSKKAVLRRLKLDRFETQMKDVKLPMYPVKNSKPPSKSLPKLESVTEKSKKSNVSSEDKDIKTLKSKTDTDSQPHKSNKTCNSSNKKENGAIKKSDKTEKDKSIISNNMSNNKSLSDKKQNVKNVKPDTQKPMQTQSHKISNNINTNIAVKPNSNTSKHDNPKQSKISFNNSNLPNLAKSELSAFKSKQRNKKKHQKKKQKLQVYKQKIRLVNSGIQTKHPKGLFKTDIPWYEQRRISSAYVLDTSRTVNAPPKPDPQQTKRKEIDDFLAKWDSLRNAKRHKNI